MIYHTQKSLRIATVIVVGTLSKLISAYSYADEKQSQLASAYKECDKLLVIVQPGEDLKPFYDSAGNVSACKEEKYRSTPSAPNDSMKGGLESVTKQDML